MAIVEVQSWLAGPRPFADGVTLLQAHGQPTGALLKLLSKETSYARERLAEALQAVLDRQLAVRPPQPRPNLHAGAHAQLAMKAGIEEHDDWPLHRYPVELQELKNKTREWISEEAHLRGELRRLPGREERYRTALRIVDLDHLRHAAYRRLDTFRATGTDIGQVQERPKTLADLMVERNNLRTYLSRHKSGTRPASPEQVATWKQRLSIVQSAIDAGNEG